MNKILNGKAVDKKISGKFKIKISGVYIEMMLKKI
jgi:hypothetical protein